MFSRGGTNIIAVTKWEPSQIQILEERYGSGALPYKTSVEGSDVEKQEAE